MLIALDYDQTYTRDPDLWDEVIASAQQRGHSFVCVTQRPQPPGTAKAERVPSIPVVCAGEDLKQDAALKAGYRVHIWIDDNPASVSQSVESAVVALKLADMSAAQLRERVVEQAAEIQRLQIALRNGHAFFSAGLTIADFDDSPAARAEYRRIKAQLDAMRDAFLLG